MWCSHNRDDNWCWQSPMLFGIKSMIRMKKYNIVNYGWISIDCEWHNVIAFLQLFEIIKNKGDERWVKVREEEKESIIWVSVKLFSLTNKPNRFASLFRARFDKNRITSRVVYVREIRKTELTFNQTHAVTNFANINWRCLNLMCDYQTCRAYH